MEQLSLFIGFERLKIGAEQLGETEHRIGVERFLQSVDYFTIEAAAAARSVQLILKVLRKASVEARRLGL